MANAEALNTIADIIEAHPSMHDQETYVYGQRPHRGERFEHEEVNAHGHTVTCGRTHCIAGWALAYEYGVIGLDQSGTGSYPAIVLPNGKTVDTAEVNGMAADILGIDDSFAEVLFHQIPQSMVDWPELLRLLADDIPFWVAVHESVYANEMTYEETVEACSDALY